MRRALPASTAARGARAAVVVASTARVPRHVGTAALRLANRAAQVGIGAALVAGLRRRDPTVVVNALVSAAFTALPRLLEVTYGARLRPWHRLWVSAAGLIHTVGMLGPYDRVWWWDHLAHTLSGVVVAAATDVVFRVGTADASQADGWLGPRARVVFGATLGFGLVWEALEFAVHAVADRLGFEPLLVHYGRRDTVGDLCFDLLGAAIVVRYGRRGLADVVDSVREP